MYDGRDGLSVWADTAWISTGERSLMEMPRSVESSWSPGLKERREDGRTAVVMDYVSGCARTIQVTPGRWSVQGIGRYCLWNVWVYVWNWKGNVPRSSGIESRS